MANIKKIELLSPDSFYEEIKRRKKKLADLASQIDLIRKSEQLDKLDESQRLRAIKSHNSYQYFIRADKKDPVGKYLNKKNEDYAKKLASREYYQKVEKEIEREIKALDFLQTKLNKNSIEKVYDNFPDAKKNLIDPVTLSDKEYKCRWESVEYKGKKFIDYKESNSSDNQENQFAHNENVPEYFTSKGERVRSKSEILIADSLARHGIAYRYEYPVRVKNDRGEKFNIYPDFCCLNVRTRAVFYWEHFGMLEIDAYARNLISKINLYHDNGIWEGQNLICTFESAGVPIETKGIEKVIEKYLV